MATIPANGEASAYEHECVANENTGDAVKGVIFDAKTVFGNDAGGVISDAKTVFGNDAAEVISDAKTVSGNGAAEVIAKPKESRTEMLARHQREIKELQNKELELKKDAAKGSKAQQKARKKEVEEETAKLRAKLKAKHDKELASLGYRSQDGKDSSDLDNLVKAIAGMNATDNVGHSGKPSKGVQRRAKRAQKEAERDQRIKEEQSNVISDRVLEDERLQNKLKPLRLSLYEIKPDGHCLYRAVENQLSLQPGNSCKHSFQQLREMAATYMRNHANDFLPFFSCDSGHDTESNVDMQENFEKYCHEVESTAAWGGHLELKALAHSLKKHVIVFSGKYPNVEMGEEYKSHNPSIMLSYHKHAYGLGEHYNSVVPVEYAAALGR